MDSVNSTDKGIFDQIVEGNEYAFERLFRRYSAPLYGYCMGIVADSAVAEDMVQDVFVYLWNNRKRIEIRASVKTYLFSSVRYGALNWLKRQKMEHSHSLRLTEFITYLQETEYSEAELSELEDVQKILNALSDRCRTVLLMSCLDGKKQKEIAEELNISVNTVKTHIMKAYQRFRVTDGQNQIKKGIT